MPVSKKGYWQIEMDDVALSGNSVASTKSAILDSGTSLLVGPTEDVKAIAAEVVSFDVAIVVWLVLTRSFPGKVWVFQG